ncbi:MAG: PLDc N-terminal domain-containing protein [Bacillota bacterium]
MGAGQNLFGAGVNVFLLIIPLLLLQIGLLIFALLDLSKREHVLGGNKLIWVLIILFFQVLGPLVYFVIGRKE